MRRNRVVSEIYVAPNATFSPPDDSAIRTKPVICLLRVLSVRYLPQSDRRDTLIENLTASLLDRL